jgi:hypothetical protein
VTASREHLIAAAECCRFIELLTEAKTPQWKQLTAIVCVRLKNLLSGNCAPKPLRDADVDEWLAYAIQTLINDGPVVM